VRKISPPPRFDPRTVQPVDNRYTDCATRATRITIKQFDIAPHLQDDMSSNTNLPFQLIILLMFHYLFAQLYTLKTTRNIQTAVYWCGVDAAEYRVSGGRTEAEVIAAA